MSSSLLNVRNLNCAYGARRGRFALSRREPEPVVHDVSFSVEAGETLALVGESGSGKTTIARAVAGLGTPAHGQILFEGRPLPPSIDRRSKELRGHIQLVFQNPDSSLNPRRRVSSILGRPLQFFFGLSGRAKAERIEELLRDVHLDARYARRFPTQLSGGERQRVAIAQALAAEPKLALCDEVVSALDVSVQASVLDLLREVQGKRGIAYLFIAHDLAVVRWLARRVVVLYRGWMMETGTAAEVFSRPVHPYTETLLKSVPDPDAASPLLGEVEPTQNGDEARPGTGCPFAQLCPRRVGPVCDREVPPWQEASATHSIRCHIPAADLARAQAFPWDSEGQRATGSAPAARA